jgi:hypothetical protein
MLCHLPHNPLIGIGAAVARRPLPHHRLMDVGVFRSLRPKGSLDSPEEIGGACLEGLVAQHLRAWIAYSKDEKALYYWRTRID